MKWVLILFIVLDGNADIERLPGLKSYEECLRLGSDRLRDAPYFYTGAEVSFKCEQQP